MRLFRRITKNGVDDYFLASHCIMIYNRASFWKLLILQSASKVDAAPVVVVQSGKKAKRAAEDEIEKAVNTKKQNVQRDEVVVAQQKAEKKKPKKVESSSSEEDSDDSSDEETKFKIGLCQLSVTADKARNIDHARKAIEDAAQKGAKLVVLPVSLHSVLLILYLCSSFFGDGWPVRDVGLALKL
ncbi:hypothetical protein BVRB_5g111660 [Beta vulgaris subsp. vulgaris]|nr:hypothetical protein BVRB_5g111660 [Beta vulgaris subsp. vulgaris]